MNNLFKTILVLFMLSSLSYGAGMLDADYAFIDTAFDGLVPVTDKQFNDTINRLTPQPVPDTFGGKLKTFLFGRKMGVETPPQQLKEQAKATEKLDEKQVIQEMKNGTYFIKLVVSIRAKDGSIIPLGNYKIQERLDDGVNYLVFYQGAKEYGKLRLQKYDDSEKAKNDITYSRVDIVNDSIVRIVYSTLKDTKCAYARVYSD